VTSKAGEHPSPRLCGEALQVFSHWRLAVSERRPKATHTGTLFDGLLDCYVLADERRVVSQNGMARSLSGATGSVNLARYVDRIDGGSAWLRSVTGLQFVLPGGRVATGIEATAIPDLLQLYVDALSSGSLHPQQLPVAARAAKMLGALAKIGIIALVDEATGYQLQRAAAELSFTFRALLLESKAQWDLMWPVDFVESVCRLHGERFEGGPQPRFLASTYEKLYHLILGEEVCAELKHRNPDPHFGTNHHQWLTPEAREVVKRQIPILIAYADTCGSKDEFWARVEHKYAKRPLQLSWLVPTRNPPEAAE
jgi:hypothetical protein